MGFNGLWGGDGIGKLTLKKCQTSTIFPQGASGADFVGRDAAPAQAHMHYVDNGDAEPSHHVPTHLQVGTLPFCSQFCCKMFGKCRCLLTSEQPLVEHTK
jgi:hypothetical protein